MSQLKALMKQKQAQARLTHPYAKYSGTRLSCSLCGPSTAGLKEVQWGSHLVSKGHRVAVRNAEAAGEAERAGKRSRQDDDADDADAGAGKRARDDDDEPSAAGALPSDFFADPSKAPPPRAAEPEVGPGSEPEPVEDDEWAAFEATLSNAPPPTIAPIASATIFAAPVMYEFGAPKVAEEGEDEAAAAAEDDEQVGETEDEKRERLEREEREEIMERIHEEEREQLEADEKVNVLKKRLEMLRGARKKKAAVE